jgi:hypothetical protein
VQLRKKLGKVIRMLSMQTNIGALLNEERMCVSDEVVPDGWTVVTKQTRICKREASPLVCEEGYSISPQAKRQRRENQEEKELNESENSSKDFQQEEAAKEDLSKAERARLLNQENENKNSCNSPLEFENPVNKREEQKNNYESCHEENGISSGRNNYSKDNMVHKLVE